MSARLAFISEGPFASCPRISMRFFSYATNTIDKNNIRYESSDVGEDYDDDEEEEEEDYEEEGGDEEANGDGKHSYYYFLFFSFLFLSLSLSLFFFFPMLFLSLYSWVVLQRSTFVN
jgi:hypothetical protein